VLIKDIDNNKDNPMTESSTTVTEKPSEAATTEKKPTLLSMDALIQFVLIILLAIWCFKIVQPFLIPVLWGLIIAVALSPVHAKLATIIAGKSSLAAFLLAGSMVATLVVPSFMLGSSSIDSLHEPINELRAGTYEMPTLSERVRTLPFVGKPLAIFWDSADTDLAGTLGQYQDTVKQAAAWIGGTLASTVGSILQSVFSIIIAAIFWVNSAVLIRGCNHIAERLFGKGGTEYVTLSGLTIQSVAQGVIGVAVIQAAMAALGLIAVGAPLAGLWVLLVLIAAVAQLPPILVLGPVAAYIFSVESSAVATVFLVWCIIVSFSDAILKPLLLGRGLDIPMIVILVGAIGGMLMSGILGLFIGAVTLGLMYQLTQKWALNK
jgi:predicted PurR-regulated permease PerM